MGDPIKCCDCGAVSFASPEAKLACGRCFEALRTALATSEAARRKVEAPIALSLVCPKCKQRHVDESEWATREHKTHLCCAGPYGGGCGHMWRPLDVPTFGVQPDDDVEHELSALLARAEKAEADLGKLAALLNAVSIALGGGEHDWRSDPMANAAATMNLVELAAQTKADLEAATRFAFTKDDGTAIVVAKVHDLWPITVDGRWIGDYGDAKDAVERARELSGSARLPGDEK